MAVIIRVNRSQLNSVNYREDESLQEKYFALKQDKVVNEVPSYGVEFNDNYNDEEFEDIEEHFKKRIEDFRNGNLFKIDFGDNSKESIDNSKKKFQDNATKFASKIDLSALIQEPPLTRLWKTDLTIVINCNRVEDLFRKGALNQVCPEARAALEKYYNARKYIEQGGRDTFLQYNLRFAAITAYENDKLSDYIGKQQIAAGQYTSEEYLAAKNYAKILQTKAGVFVTTDFVYDGYARRVATGITYSYNGLVCDIGTEELNFMAHHEEAQSIWVKVAQGEYKNKEKIVQVLCDSGYKDTAEQFAVKCTGEISIEAGFLSEKFMHGDTGSADDYQQLYQNLFGDTEIRPRYSTQQLDAAYYREGKQGSENFATYLLDRDPMKLYIDGKGYATNKDHTNKINSLESKISEL